MERTGIAKAHSTKAFFLDSCNRNAAKDELDFYIEAFGHGKTLPKRTLEVGCGTGQFLLPLLEKGLQGIGVEKDDVMFEILQKQAANSGLLADTRLSEFKDFHDPTGFDGIVAFHVIGHILDSEVLRSFFRKAFDLLLPNGLFLFSYDNMFESWKSKQWNLTTTHCFEDGFGRMERSYTPKDRVEGVAAVQSFITIGKSGVPQFIHDKQHIRFYTMTELVLLLEETGFSQIQTYADLNGTPLGDEEMRGHVLYTTARRP